MCKYGPYCKGFRWCLRAGTASDGLVNFLIDDVLTYRITVERAQDVVRGLFAHPVDGLPGDARNMRGDDDIGKLEQRMGDGRRLLLENIEARAGEFAGRERVVECGFNDDAAARGIDQIGRWLHPLEPCRIEHADGFRGLRAVYADEIGTGQSGIK